MAGLKVVITGASSGIGEALAVYYAAKGARLGLIARRGEVLASLNQRLGGQHACYALDVGDAPALHAAAHDFIAHFGAPDIVIASAGVSAGTLTEYEEDLAVFRRVMEINVFGMAATFAPFIPAMKAASGERRLVRATTDKGRNQGLGRERLGTIGRQAGFNLLERGDFSAEKSAAVVGDDTDIELLAIGVGQDRNATISLHDLID